MKQDIAEEVNNTPRFQFLTAQPESPVESEFIEGDEIELPEGFNVEEAFAPTSAEQSAKLQYLQREARLMAGVYLYEAVAKGLRDALARGDSPPLPFNREAVHELTAEFITELVTRSSNYLMELKLSALEHFTGRPRQEVIADLLVNISNAMQEQKESEENG